MKCMIIDQTRGRFCMMNGRLECDSFFHIIMTRILETNDLKGLATFLKSGECKKVALMVRSNQ